MISVRFNPLANLAFSRHILYGKNSSAATCRVTANDPSKTPVRIGDFLYVWLQ